jgi:transposase
VRHDDEAVRRILAGQAPFTGAHDADRDQVVRLLLAEGMTVWQVAERLGTGRATVQRVQRVDRERAARLARLAS